MRQRKYRTNAEWAEIYQQFYVKEKLTLSDISIKIGQCTSLISRKFKILGLSVKKNPDHKVLFDDHVFDNWSTESAYWLGFIAADGSVYLPKRSLAVSASLRDKTHLEKLALFLKTDKKISSCTRPLKGKGKLFTQCYLTVTSRHLIDRLQYLGIVQNKSGKNIDFMLHVPEKYRFSFMLGLMDGDGHIRLRDRGRGEIAWLGNKKVIESVSKCLTSMNFKNSVRCRKDCSLGICHIYSMDSRARFIQKWMSHSVFLDRKKEKAEKMLAVIKTCKRYIKSLPK